MRGRYTRRRLDISYENEWYNKEHLPASVRCPAPRALTATAAPAPPSVMWRSTILRRPKFRTRPNGAKAADTPWTLRLRPHFRDVVRFDCRRYRRAG